MNVTHSERFIFNTILKILKNKKLIKKLKKCRNPYGKGDSSKKIVHILKNIKINKKLLDKVKLTPLMIDTKDIDVTNNEAVVKDGKAIGYITSGGFAHYVKKSIAFSYIDEKILKTNNKFQVEINGSFYECEIIKEPLYDPRGTKMRS